MSNDPSGALVLVAGAAAYLVWRYRTRDERPEPAGRRPDDAATAAPSSPGPAPELREVDFVLARCGHPGHIPGHIPTAQIRRRSAGMDVRDMRKNGWGSTDRLTLCYSHNTLALGLGSVYVECDLGCGTRGDLDAGDPDVGIGDLRYRGWRNDGDLLVCPYCAGTRDRRWR